MARMEVEPVDGQAAGRRWPLRAAALFAAIFGALTLRGGALALFGGVDAGAVVPFVLWFNFLAGFAYLVGACGLWLGRRWSLGLAIAIAICTALVFGAFGLHVATGGVHEPRTVAMMSLRTVSWLAIALLARTEFRCGQGERD